MSKERLEDAEKNFDWMNLRPSQINEVSWIIDYAKEQAERVQELEEEIKTHEPHGRNYTNEQYVKLRLENKRYREAIHKAIHEVDEGYYPEWIIANLNKALEESP